MFLFLHALSLATLLSAATPEDDKAKAAAAAPSNVAITKSMSMAIYPSVDHSKVNLHVENHAGRKLSVNFLNQRGEPLASEYIPGRKQNYHAKFNVEALNRGTYQITVSDGKETLTKTFQINDTPAVNPSRVMLVE